MGTNSHLGRGAVALRLLQDEPNDGRVHSGILFGVQFEPGERRDERSEGRC